MEPPSLLEKDPILERRLLVAITDHPPGGSLDELGLSSRDFSDERCRHWWTSISSLESDGQPISRGTVARWLSVAGHLGDGKLIDSVWYWESFDDSRTASEQEPSRGELAFMAAAIRDCAVTRCRLAAIRKALDNYLDDPDAAIAKLISSLASPATDVDRAPLLDDVTICEQPDVPWLVRHVLPARGLGVLAGEPGAGKTFAALALGLSVASGRPWLGFRVQASGPVLYSLAEGAAGRGARVKAWKTRNGLALDRVAGLHFYDRAFTFTDLRAVERFIRRARRLGVVLVIIDTFARHFGGESENDAAQVGAFVAICDRLRDTLGCAVLVVHHVGVNGDRERGSTALRGAADLLMLLKVGDGELTLECAKAKDAEPFPAVTARLEPVGDSLVCVAACEASPTEGDLTRRQREVVDCMRKKFGPSGTTIRTLAEVAGIPKSTLYEAVTALAARGILIQKHNHIRLSLSEAIG